MKRSEPIQRKSAGFHLMEPLEDRCLLAGDGLTGTYFDNGTFSGAVLQRVDPAINFNFGKGSPAPQIAADNFSVQWTGQIQASTSETYTLYVKADDGVSLTINGFNVIDKLSAKGGAKTYSAKVPLVAGQSYPITLNYVDKTGTSSVQLLWSSKSIKKQVIPQSALFSGAPTVGSTAPAAPTITGLTAASSSQINLTWADNAAGNESGFLIERATDLAFTNPVQMNVAAGVTSFADTGLADGTRYFYRVSAVKGSATSQPSGAAAAVTLLPAPSNLVVNASLGQGQVGLLWQVNSVSQTGFLIYRSSDGGQTFLPVAAVPGFSNNYVDSGLPASTTFVYQVQAVVDGVAASPLSNAQGGTTLPGSAVPAAPSSLASVAVSSSQINLTWIDNAVGNEDGFVLQRATDLNFTNPVNLNVGAGVTSFVDAGLADGTRYFYRLVAVEGSAISQPSAPAAAVTFLPAPSNLTVNSAIGQGEVGMQWQVNSADQTGFMVYRSADGGQTFVPVALVPAFSNNYIDGGLANSTTFVYEVQAIVNGVAASPFSNAQAATTLASSDTTPPARPTFTLVTATSSTQINLAWTANTESDFHGYNVYRGTTFGFIASPANRVSALQTSTSFADTSVSPNTTYFYQVTAVDKTGNESAPVGTQVTTPGAADTQAPAAPGNVHVSATTTSTISIAWTAATDNVGVTAYQVFRDGAQVATPGGSTLSYTDVGLVAGTSHNYVVKAIDAAGNISAASTTVTGQTNPNNNPSQRDAFSTIQANSADAVSGVTNGGSGLAGLATGGWAKYAGVNFGSTGALTFQATVASTAQAEGAVRQIVVHVDSLSGPVVATLNVQTTGGVTTFFLQHAAVNGITGVHDVYLSFNGGAVGSLSSFMFSTKKLVTIMPLGDSITQGYVGHLSYRDDLYKELVNAGYNVDFVGTETKDSNGNPGDDSAEPPAYDFDQNHEGFAGLRTDQVLAQLQALGSALPSADIVMIHLGTNDLIEGKPASTAINNIGQIINLLRGINPNVQILLAQIIPTSGADTPGSTVPNFNALVPGLASSMSTAQSPIHVVDQYDGFSQANTYDSIHPNAVGEQQMADKWFASLQSVLGSPN